LCPLTPQQVRLDEIKLKTIIDSEREKREKKINKLFLHPPNLFVSWNLHLREVIILPLFLLILFVKGNFKVKKKWPFLFHHPFVYFYFLHLCSSNVFYFLSDRYLNLVDWVENLKGDNDGRPSSLKPPSFLTKSRGSTLKIYKRKYLLYSCINL